MFLTFSNSLQFFSQWFHVLAHGVNFIHALKRIWKIILLFVAGISYVYASGSWHKIEFISAIPLLYFFDFMKATGKKKKEKKITNPVTMNFVPYTNENVNCTRSFFNNFKFLLTAKLSQKVCFMLTKIMKITKLITM